MVGNRGNDFETSSLLSFRQPLPLWGGCPYPWPFPSIGKNQSSIIHLVSLHSLPHPYSEKVTWRVFYLQSSTRGYKSIHTAAHVRCGLCPSLCTQTVEGSDLVKHICSSDSNYYQMSCLLNNFSKHFFSQDAPSFVLFLS